MASNSIDSILRLSGMSSGLDTESMVKSLMRVEQLKVDRVWQQKTRLEWQKDARTEVTGKITAFRTATMSVLSRDTNLFSASAFNTFKVNRQNSTAGFTATANEQATAGRHQIDSISQLATAATAASSTSISSEPLSRGTKLEDLALTVPLEFGGENGDELAFKINGTAITVKKSATLQELMTQVNTSGAQVVASYSELTGRISFMSRSTGAASAITIENISGNAFGDDSAFAITGTSWQNGQDARLSIDGVAVTRSSNYFTIDGISYQLNEVLSTPASFTVERDVEPTVERIRNFVNQFNSLLDYVQGKTSESVYSDYPPLTNEQRDELSESEAKLWDEKAKSGLLYRDRALTSLVAQMRRAFYEVVDGTDKCAAHIGLKTGLYSERGRINLDETALRNALNEDPDRVARLFTQTSSATDPKAKYAGSGLLSRLTQAFSDYSATIDTTRTNREIENLSKRIDNLNTSLTKKEENYWSRFTAMEQALYTLQNQSSWLSSYNS